MDFRIADTFTDSLAKLTGEEQKAVKTTAFDLQLNPANPGMSLHKLDKARDKHFWSVRVSSDIRLIVHKSDASLLLCYVDHHDPAYEWANRRKLETHPKTGAAQWVEIRERVEEVRVPYSSGDADLPAEASEASLELATGGKPQVTQPTTGTDPYSHPDAQRRFRVMNDVEELERALEFPWEKWTIFLYPAQRQWVDRDYSGPARVSGSAGTGKTIVALHRAVFLARSHPESRVLLVTFSDTLANALLTKLRRLISNEPRLAERLEVHAMNAIGERLYEQQFGRPHIASSEAVKRTMKAAASNEKTGQKFSLNFLLTEWEELVDAWQLDSWGAYRDVKRLGRKTRLPERASAFHSRVQNRGFGNGSCRCLALGTQQGRRRSP